jgi:hypothetical protein
MKKATNEDIIYAYRTYGNVWLAAKHLGMCGQSVWERLKRIGVELYSQKWTPEETAELTALAPECTVGEIARRLGRSYAGTACKISELQLGVRYGNQVRTSIKRGSGMTKANTAAYLKQLSSFGGSIRQFCVQHGLTVEILVQGIQRHHKDGWDLYVSEHSELEFRPCEYCTKPFLPMNSKQLTCSRRCGSHRRSDKKYFGGKRRQAVGMEEGICQLCEKERLRLAAHHIIGKENDPDNDLMIALCPGCHQLVGSLGGRADVTRVEMWENLIALAVARKMGSSKPIGYHVTVEIEALNESDL